MNDFSKQIKNHDSITEKIIKKSRTHQKRLLKSI